MFSAVMLLKVLAVREIVLPFMYRIEPICTGCRVQVNKKVKPYEFADIIDAMGRWYNKGLLVVEKASGGHSCIERLRYDKKYMNMYKYKCYDEFKRTIWKVGFDTSNKTKSIAVNDMREVVR